MIKYELSFIGNGYFFDCDYLTDEGKESINEIDKEIYEQFEGLQIELLIPPQIGHYIDLNCYVDLVHLSDEAKDWLANGSRVRIDEITHSNTFIRLDCYQGAIGEQV